MVKRRNNYKTSLSIFRKPVKFFIQIFHEYKVKFPSRSNLLIANLKLRRILLYDRLIDEINLFKYKGDFAGLI